MTEGKKRERAKEFAELCNESGRKGSCHCFWHCPFGDKRCVSVRPKDWIKEWEGKEWELTNF